MLLYLKIQARIIRQLVFVLATICVPLVLYPLAVAAVITGEKIAVSLGVIMISPVMMWLLHVTAEEPEDFRTSFAMFDPRKQSGAFLFGDTIALPVATFFFVRGWENVPYDSRFVDGRDWFYLAVMLGFGIAVIFALIDHTRYEKIGRHSALYSPTKLWHDIAVFWTVSSVVVFTMVPQLFGHMSMDTFIGLAALTVFGGLAGADGVRDLDPTYQHPLWNIYDFEPIKA